MSRPRWSVPSQCASPGRASVAAASVAMGSCVCSMSAKIAVTTMISTSTPPAAPSGFFLTNRRTTAATESRRTPMAGRVSSISAPIGLTAM